MVILLISGETPLGSSFFPLVLLIWSLMFAYCCKISLASYLYIFEYWFFNCIINLEDTSILFFHFNSFSTTNAFCVSSWICLHSWIIRNTCRKINDGQYKNSKLKVFLYIIGTKINKTDSIVYMSECCRYAFWRTDVCVLNKWMK